MSLRPVSIIRLNRGRLFTPSVRFTGWTRSTSPGLIKSAIRRSSVSAHVFISLAQPEQRMSRRPSSIKNLRKLKRQQNLRSSRGSKRLLRSRTYQNRQGKNTTRSAPVQKHRSLRALLSGRSRGRWLKIQHPFPCRKQGVEISVSSGTPVSSAAAGKVIYSGDGITGYGNLLIVRHDDSFLPYTVTIRKIWFRPVRLSVKVKIALSGQPPSGGVPRVYFEIRYGKKPVDPVTYLP